MQRRLTPAPSLWVSRKRKNLSPETSSTLRPERVSSLLCHGLSRPGTHTLQYKVFTSAGFKLHGSSDSDRTQASFICGYKFEHESDICRICKNTGLWHIRPGLIRVQFRLLCPQIANCFLMFYSSRAVQIEWWTPKLSHPTYLTFPEHSNQPVLSSSPYTWLVSHSSLSPKQSKEKKTQTSEI